MASAKSPYHVTDYLRRAFLAAGFSELDPKTGVATPGGRYIMQRGGKTLCAWIQGTTPEECPVRLLSAHTDFPAMKVRPNTLRDLSNCAVFDADLYNGPIIETWFDRDLRINGMVAVREGASIAFKLVDLDAIKARLLSVAPHLSSGDRKRDPILRCVWANGVEKSAEAFKEIVATAAGVAPDAVIEWDLWLTTTEEATEFGLDQKLVNAQAADNVLSCAVALGALLADPGAQTPWTRMAVFFDFEEVGSASWSGAQSTFLPMVMRKANCGDVAMDASYHLALDVAHAMVDPGGADIDKFNMPHLGKGPVLKLGSPGRYSHALSLSAALKVVAQSADIPLQTFMYPTGQRRGGSLSPYVAAGLGIRTVDFGTPIVGMHSVRELFAMQDAVQSLELMRQFLAYDIAMVGSSFE